eukprot:1306666-Amphidinium_carterae.5
MEAEVNLQSQQHVIFIESEARAYFDARWSALRHVVNKLPKLTLSQGDASKTTVELETWLSLCSTTINTWGVQAAMIWQQTTQATRNAHIHKQWNVLAPSQRALNMGSTNPMFAMTPLNLSEANIKAELLSTKVSPNVFVNHVLAKRASTIEEILTPLLQRYLPSEPTARVDALASAETPLRPAKTYMAVQPLMSSLMYTPAFSIAHANIFAVTSIKLTPTPSVLWRYVDVLVGNSTIEHLNNMSTTNRNHMHMVLSHGMMLKLMAQRRGKMAARARGGQCRLRHPTTPGNCLRCGGKGHSVQECRRPRRDKPAPKPQPKPGKGALQLHLHVLPTPGLHLSLTHIFNHLKSQWRAEHQLLHIVQTYLYTSYNATPTNVTWHDVPPNIPNLLELSPSDLL